MKKLPKIYVFSNGGEPGWKTCYAMAEDGTVLGSHVCSHEGFAPHDLGVTAGSRPDRHEHYKEHYPDGYEMEFVPESHVRVHPGLSAAYAFNKKMAEAS